MNSSTVQDEISSYTSDLVEVSLVKGQVVYEMEAGFERINCIDALNTWLQIQGSEKEGSPHLRMEAVEVHNNVRLCAFTASLWGSNCRKRSEIWADCLWDNTGRWAPGAPFV